MNLWHFGCRSLDDIAYYHSSGTLLRKTCNDVTPLGQDLNRRPPAYEAGVVPVCSITMFYYSTFTVFPGIKILFTYPSPATIWTELSCFSWCLPGKSVKNHDKSQNIYPLKFRHFHIRVRGITVSVNFNVTQLFSKERPKMILSLTTA